MVDYEDLTGEQQDAADALERNVTLTAGAGTGKTTTLTARYLRMLEHDIDTSDEADDGQPAAGNLLLPEEIVTTTFTERAANDLKESVRGEITDRISTLDPEEYERWRTIADNLNEGYIHTLHGFCARLLREHAIRVAAVDPGFETLDQDETTALIDDTVVTLLEEYDDHQAVQTLARRFDRSDLEAVLTDLLRERPASTEWAETWVDRTEPDYLNYVQSHLHPIAPEDAAELLSTPAFIEAVEELAAITNDPPDIDTGGRAWERAVALVDELNEESFDDGIASRSKQRLLADICDILTTGDGDEYSSYTGAASNWGGADAAKERFDGAIETVVELVGPEEHLIDASLAVDANSFPLVQALAELTLIAAEEYEDRKDRQNAVDFTDQIGYAVSFLKNDANADVRETLRERFAYVMVDEFQDTDPRQWELIKLLTSEDPDAFDARNVFVVGDVKQSIYRFRNADVTQFEETANTLEATNEPGQDDHDGAGADDAADAGDDREQLSVNFRTLPGVLGVINELFDDIFEVEGAPYEAAPQPLTAHRDDPGDVGSMEYLAVPSDPELREYRFDHYPSFANERPDHDAELEAMALAARLTQVLGEPYEVYETEDEQDDEQDDSIDGTPEAEDAEKSGPEARSIEPEDIAILLRSRTHLKAYERALEDAEIPYSVASGVGFYDTPEVTALTNLLKALADPDDERALYAVLRSALFGLPDDTIAMLKRDGEPLWEALSEAESDELAGVYDQMVEWQAHAGIGDDVGARSDPSWAAFLTRIIEDTGYLVSVSADERPQQAAANVEKFREQLRGWSDDGVRSLKALVDRIERRTELGDREGEADIPGEGEGIQILTVHDAKGMEFPFVVVPGLSRSFNDEAAIGGGRVEFERIDDEHAIGMKAPEPEEPFEMAGTVARAAIREQRRAEERAEEKRVLYVACTRARDHLLLSGLHDVDEDVEEPVLEDLDAADMDSPSSWRDWVQPQLFDEDALATLGMDTAVQRPLGDHTYRLSIPTPPVDLTDDSDPPEPTVELSRAPERPPIQFRLTPTQLASLFEGYGSLTLDESSRTVIFDSEDSETGDGGDGQEEGLAPTVFGELVHRLCELRPPESRWSAVMRQTLVDEDADQPLTPDLEERVTEHASRALAFVEEARAGTTIEGRYDELHVTAEFDAGEISGLIDHLLVTPDRYHIIDYKTGDLSADELDTEAAYYRTQLETYAIALHQQDDSRSVTASLYFTDIETDWTETWTPTQLDSMTAELESEIQRRLETVIR